METFVKVFFVLMLPVVIAGYFIRLFVIIPALNRRGIDAGTMNIHQLRELKQYKAICIEENKPLTWWRISVGLHITFGLGVVSYLVAVVITGFIQG